MSTVIYPSPIFGPVHSRRLGISLGINLMPADGKVCTFDCIYCECGFNADHRPKAKRPTREEVAEALERKLAEMVSDGQLPDVLTFAGNGEPTAHPDFGGIIDDTIRLRDKYCPKAKVSVLSNATRAMLPEVHKALERVDNNIEARHRRPGLHRKGKPPHLPHLRRKGGYRSYTLVRRQGHRTDNVHGRNYERRGRGQHRRRIRRSVA